MCGPPLRFLHAESSLSQTKIDSFSRLTTDELVESLQPGRTGSLKARPDGIVIDGHHRLKVLKDRGYDVDLLPREVISRDDG